MEPRHAVGNGPRRAARHSRAQWRRDGSFIRAEAWSAQAASLPDAQRRYALAAHLRRQRTARTPLLTIRESAGFRRSSAPRAWGTSRATAAAEARAGPV